MTSSKRLADYLRWAGAQPFAYGRWDCLIGLVAEWVRRERGGDPAAPWRGRYSTALGCARLVKREGGLLAVLSRGAALAGLEAAVAPRAGCIAAVEPHGAAGGSLAGAICTGAAWAVLSPAGIGLIAARPLGVWRV